MIEIAIDGNEANKKERDGVSQFAYELLWALYNLRNEWSNSYRFLIFLNQAPLKILPSENEIWKYKVLSGKGLWILRKLMPELFKNKEISIFFSPSHYLPLISPVKMICTIHDLGYLKYSGQFKKYDFWQLKIWTAISIFISKYIIAVSDFTKQDIVRHYKIPSNKIVVSHHGFNSNRFNSKISYQNVRRIKQKYGIRNNYILFLSTLKPSKNIESLIRAFKIIVRNYPEYKLVIAGRKGWMYEDIYILVKKLCLDNEVIFTNFIPESEKPYLMKGARVIVSPSYWEGFGMHVLEAMACGTPVIVSGVTSLPEICGKAALYVDPFNIKSISDALDKVIKMSENEYNKLVKLSLKQASKFNWNKSAREIIRVFNKLS